MTIIEFDEECSECHGTGVYVGMAEKDGYGVVCYHCDGTGKYKYKHEFHEFTERKINNKVKNIVECNPGICLGGNFDFGGILYRDWLNGKQFERGTEMRNFTCPAWWFQISDYDKKPNWNKCICVGRFSECKHFSEKQKCWEEYDIESR